MGGNVISWTICKSFAPHSRQITVSVPHHWVFTGRMPFLPSNQQCQSITINFSFCLKLLLFESSFGSSNCATSNGGSTSRKTSAQNNPCSGFQKVTFVLELHSRIYRIPLYGLTNNIIAMNLHEWNKPDKYETSIKVVTWCCWICCCMLSTTRLTGGWLLSACSTTFNHAIVSVSRSFSCPASSYAAVSWLRCSIDLSFSTSQRAATSSSDCRSCAVTSDRALFAILCSPCSSSDLILASTTSLDSNISWTPCKQHSLQLPDKVLSLMNTGINAATNKA